MSGGIWAGGHDKTTDSFYQGTGINADPTMSGGGDYTADGRGQRTDIAERDRYRGLGEAAANRQAYNVDFDAAQGDRNNGNAARQGQILALNMQRQAALGNAPSRAEILGGQVGGQSLEGALSASAGARPGGMAAAQMAARGGMGAVQNGASQQLTGLRSQELGHALGAYGHGANVIRGGDYQAQAMAQQQAEAQAQAEIAQRHLNQQGQMGYEQMGVNTEQAQLDSKMRMAGVANQQQQTADAANDANDERWWKLEKAAAGSVSDANAKQNAHMLSDDRTKLASAWDEGHQAALANVEKMGRMTPAQLKASERPEASAVRSLKGDGFDEGRHAGTKAQHAAFNREMDAGAEERQRHFAEMNAAAAAQRQPQTAPAPVAPPPMRPPGAQVSQLGDPQGHAFGGPAPAPAPQPAQPGYFARAHAALQGIPDAMSDQLGKLYSDGRTKTNAKSADPMTDALASGLKPYTYEYKPGFAEAEGQKPHEQNVGPMAQDMASNPITGQAVSERPDGLLQIDMKKATKLSLAAAGHNAQKIRELEARMKGGR